MSYSRSIPPPAARFTKRQVNRAGKLLLELRERTERYGAERAIADFDEDELDRAWEALTWWRSLHAGPLSAVAANLRYHVDQAGARVEGRIEVTQRLKRLPTLIGKLGRERGNVTQMHDIGGVRAVVPGLRDVLVVRRRLLKSWTIIKERDYVSEPKHDGYRALHLIVNRWGFPIEVQLRTMPQDSWANAVENAGRAQGLALKFGEGTERERYFFVALSEVIAGYEHADLSADNLRVALSELPSLTIRGEDR
jgi:putative GTP pyrophosphokinase